MDSIKDFVNNSLQENEMAETLINRLNFAIQAKEAIIKDIEVVDAIIKEIINEMKEAGIEL